MSCFWCGNPAREPVKIGPDLLESCTPCLVKYKEENESPPVIPGVMFVLVNTGYSGECPKACCSAPELTLDNRDPEHPNYEETFDGFVRVNEGEEIVVSVYGVGERCDGGGRSSECTITIGYRVGYKQGEIDPCEKKTLFRFNYESLVSAFKNDEEIRLYYF